MRVCYSLYRGICLKSSGCDILSRICGWTLFERRVQYGGMSENSTCSSFVRTRQVAFHDTDASGVAHFTRLLCLVEEVEHECLRSCGLEVLSPDCGWPRVHVEVDYSSSAGLGDWLSIELGLGTVGGSSLEWTFEVYHSERMVMKGRYVVVRVGKGGKAQTISEAERRCLISGFSKEGNVCK